MKTLIFICLKIAELIGFCLATSVLAGLLYIIGFWNPFQILVHDCSVTEMIIIGIVYVLVILAVILIVLLIYVTFNAYIIPANKKWTNQIHEKYFK